MKNYKLLTFIANRTRQLREEKNISQADILNDTGIHIGRIETGSRNISISTVVAICDYFEVSIGEFFDGYY